MARRKRPEPQQQASFTRRDALRQRKSARERRMLLSVLGPIAALVLLIVGFGAFRELVQKPRQPVARVDGTAILASDYTSRLAYERLQLLNTLQSFSQFAQVSSEDDDFLRNFAEQSRTGLTARTIDTLIDEFMIRQEADNRGVEVTDEEVLTEIYSNLPSAAALESLQASESITETEGVTSTEVLTTTGAVTGTDGVTTTAKPTLSQEQATGATREADADYELYVRQSILDRTGISESQYKEIIRNQLLRTKLQEALGEEVEVAEPQVEVAYLAFASGVIADEAAAALESGAAWNTIIDRYRPPGEPIESSESTGVLTGTLPLTTTVPVTGTIPTDGAEVITSTTVDTETVAGEELGVTDTVTRTSPITASEAVTATDGLTDTLAVPTPAPTATPDPYWSSEGERSWLTRQGLKDSLGLSDTEATEILESASDTVPRVMDGRQGMYLMFVYDSDDERPLPEAELETKRTAALESWLSTRRIEVSIDRFPLESVTPPEPEWFLSLYESIVGTSLPQITDPIQITTAIAPSSAATAVPPGP